MEFASSEAFILEGVSFALNCLQAQIENVDDLRSRHLVSIFDPIGSNVWHGKECIIEESLNADNTNDHNDVTDTLAPDASFFHNPKNVKIILNSFSMMPKSLFAYSATVSDN